MKPQNPKALPKRQLTVAPAKNVSVPHAVIAKVEESSHMIDAMADRVRSTAPCRRRDLVRLLDAVSDVLRPAEIMLLEADGKTKWKYAPDFGGRNKAYQSDQQTDAKAVAALIRQLRQLQHATSQLTNTQREQLYVNRILIRSIRIHLRDGFGVEPSE
jgi:hypothetical protein